MPGGPHVPLSVAATWPLPNYVNPERRGWGLVAVTVALFSLDILVVGARLWARFVLRGNGGLDDWFILAAMVPTLALAIVICLGSRIYGYDRHIWDVPLELAIQSRKVVMAIECVYILSVTLTKISILLFYRRLTDGVVSKRFIWIIQFCMMTVVLYAIIFEAMLFFGCKPIHAFWDAVDPIWNSTHDWKCLNELLYVYGANIISVVQDFMACIIPCALFWKLKIPMRQKVALGVIFCLGFFLCATSIVRIFVIRAVYEDTYDVTWAVEPFWYWTVIEACGAILCASAPALKVFFKRYLNVTTRFRGYGSSGRRGPTEEESEAKDLQDLSGVRHKPSNGKFDPYRITVTNMDTIYTTIGTSAWAGGGPSQDDKSIDRALDSFENIHQLQPHHPKTFISASPPPSSHSALAPHSSPPRITPTPDHATPANPNTTTITANPHANPPNKLRRKPSARAPEHQTFFHPPSPTDNWPLRSPAAAAEHAHGAASSSSRGDSVSPGGSFRRVRSVSRSGSSRSRRTESPAPHGARRSWQGGVGLPLGGINVAREVDVSYAERGVVGEEGGESGRDREREREGRRWWGRIGSRRGSEEGERRSLDERQEGGVPDGKRWRGW